MAPAGLGVAWMLQAVPFQPSANVTVAPELFWYEPTAVHADGPLHESDDNLPFRTVAVPWSSQGSDELGVPAVALAGGYSKLRGIAGKRRTLVCPGAAGGAPVAGPPDLGSAATALAVTCAFTLWVLGAAAPTGNALNTRSTKAVVPEVTSVGQRAAIVRFAFAHGALPTRRRRTKSSILKRCACSEPAGFFTQRAAYVRQVAREVGSAVHTDYPPLLIDGIARSGSSANTFARQTRTYAPAKLVTRS